jgi:hypothetical protein
MLHQQLRPKLTLDTLQDELSHRSQVLRVDAVQSQARRKIWCRWRPRIATRKMMPQRRNLGSHSRHLAWGQNIHISCSLFPQYPNYCSIPVEFLTGHISPTAKAKFTIRCANLWFVVEGHGLTLELFSRPVIVCSDMLGIGFVGVGRGVNGTQMQSHNHSWLSFPSTTK